MSKPLILRALDTTVAVETGGRVDQAMRDAYLDLLAPDNVPPEHTVTVRGPLFRRVTVDGVAAERPESDDDALLIARRAINQLAVNSVAATHTVLTASAIEIDGKVVVLFGGNRSGKSTLALAAARRGHGYVADDVVAIGPDLMVRPFHRPIGVRQDRAGELGVTIPSGPYDHGYPLVMSREGRLSAGGPLGLVVMASRGNAIATPPIEPGWALMLMANNAVRAPGHERVMFRRLGQLVKTQPFFRMTFDDANAGLAIIERSLQGERVQI